MKKPYYLLLSLSMAIVFSACSQYNETIPETDGHADEVLVKLNVGGEITADYSPLTRASSTNDLLGIQVDRINSAGSVEGHFAFGLFDHLDDICIYLKKEYTYKITATMIKDGKNKLHRAGDGYYHPFANISDNRSRRTTVSSGFSYNFYYYLNNLSSPIIYDTSANTISSYPKVDRLYGTITNYKPTIGGDVNIELKRVSFGLSYEVSGLDEGTLDVKIEKKNTNAKTFVDATRIENGYKSDASYYTFTDMITAYERGDSYFETFTVTVRHNHFVNLTEELGSVDVKIYRNKLNNIRINLHTIASIKAREGSGKRPSIVSVEYEDLKY